MRETFARGRKVGPGELAQIRSAAKAEAGTFIDAGSPDAIREKIREGVCPFCGESKYTNLAGHMNRSHGHSAAEVREMAGMLKGEPLCAPELSQAQRDRMRGRRLPDQAYTKPKKRREYSTAGRQAIVARLETARQIAGGQAALSRIGARAAVQSTELRQQEQLERAADLWREGRSLAEIGAEVGLHPRTVRRGLVAAGLTGGDGRTWARTRAGKVPPTSAETEAARRAKAAELARLRRARFEELGGDWHAVALLAAELGVSEKSLRAFLRKVGAQIGDGRTVSPRRMGHVRRPTVKRPCSVIDCDTDAVCRGMCRRHYQRSRRKVRGVLEDAAPQVPHSEVVL